MSQLDEARNIPEPCAIAESLAQQHRTSRISTLHRSCWLFLPLLAALFVGPCPALSQLYTGSVTGVVTDSSGATIPAVKITLVDQAKGYSFTATTDNTGRYLLRSIPPGTYTITAEVAEDTPRSQRIQAPSRPLRILRVLCGEMFLFQFVQACWRWALGSRLSRYFGRRMSSFIGTGVPSHNAFLLWSS